MWTTHTIAVLDFLVGTASDAFLPCSHLTALGLDYYLVDDIDDEDADEMLASLVDALPQLQALDPGKWTDCMSDTGLHATWVLD